MFDGSDTVVLYNELGYEEVRPSSWVPLTGSVDAAQAASFTDAMSGCCRRSLPIRGPRLIRQPDDSTPDLVRLDFKITCCWIWSASCWWPSPATGAGGHPFQCTGRRVPPPHRSRRSVGKGISRSICAIFWPSRCG